LKCILIYGAVSDADMEKGQLRCDCNVSVREESQQELGAKIEIKNMNSISGVRRALTYEIGRQIGPMGRLYRIHLLGSLAGFGNRRPGVKPRL